jgi:hypothetical protein
MEGFAMHLPLVDAHGIEVIERCIARVLRALDPREAFDVQPEDAVCPVLRNYPYGPPTR